MLEAVTPRDEIAGRFVVEQPGQYGLMHIYGEDDTALPPIGGFREGEPVRLLVNGFSPKAATQLSWQDDRTPHEMTLQLILHPTYLPLVWRSQ